MQPFRCWCDKCKCGCGANAERAGLANKWSQEATSRACLLHQPITHNCVALCWAQPMKLQGGMSQHIVLAMHPPAT